MRGYNPPYGKYPVKGTSKVTCFCRPPVRAYVWSESRREMARKRHKDRCIDLDVLRHLGIKCRVSYGEGAGGYALLRYKIKWFESKWGKLTEDDIRIMAKRHSIVYLY